MKNKAGFRMTHWTYAELLDIEPRETVWDEDDDVYKSLRIEEHGYRIWSTEEGKVIVEIWLDGWFCIAKYFAE